MKQFISAIAIAGLFTTAACNSSNKNAALEAKQRTIDSMNTELVKKRTVDSMNEVSRTQYVFPGAATQQPPAVVTSTSRSTHHRYSGSSSTQSGGGGTVAQAPAQTTKHKKGWSAKAKGAVIGAGTGAVVGAVVNKRNRAAGAVIGTVLGAATGTGVGAIIDKKHGR